MRAGAQTQPRSSGDALRAFALYQVDVAGRALGSDAARLHVGIHEARKAMRRTRAALELGAAIAGFDGSCAAELKLLCRRLSAPRDAYISVKTLEKLVGSHRGGEHEPALRRLLDRFSRGHQRQIARLRQADPGMRKLRARLVALRAQIAGLPWARSADAEEAHAAIISTVRKVERAARKARAAETGETRHRWRRRLRRLRYQIEIAEGELGVEAAALAEPLLSEPSAARIARMTDLLGDEHDLRLVLAALESPRSAAPRHEDFAPTQRLLLKAIADKAGALRP